MKKQASSNQEPPHVANASALPRRQSRVSFEEIDIREETKVPVNDDPLPPSNGGSGGQ